jgi:hypothetical protein
MWGRERVPVIDFNGREDCETKEDPTDGQSGGRCGERSGRRDNRKGYRNLHIHGYFRNRTCVLPGHIQVARSVRSGSTATCVRDDWMNFPRTHLDSRYADDRTGCRRSSPRRSKQRSNGRRVNAGFRADRQTCALPLAQSFGRRREGWKQAIQSFPPDRRGSKINLRAFGRMCVSQLLSPDSSGLFCGQLALYPMDCRPEFLDSIQMQRQSIALRAK